MESSQDSSQVSVVHDEITLDNSNSGDETNSSNVVQYENKKNISMSYSAAARSHSECNASSPTGTKPNYNTLPSQSKQKAEPPAKNRHECHTLPNQSRGGDHQYAPPPSSQRKKVTEWDVVTHVSLAQDVDLPKLYVDHKDPLTVRFYCVSTNLADKEEACRQMMLQYDMWRRSFNEFYGYRTANQMEEEEEEDRGLSDQEGEDEENFIVEGIERCASPVLMNNENFPILGGNSSQYFNVAASSSSRRTSSPEIDLEAVDPDEEDFVPSSQNNAERSKPKRTQYKPVPPDANIFDFDENLSAWNKTKQQNEPSQPKSKHSGKNRNNLQQQQPPPQSQLTSSSLPEEAMPCPICFKQFPISEIQNHASDCLSYQEDNQPK